MPASAMPRPTGVKSNMPKGSPVTSARTRATMILGEVPVMVISPPISEAKAMGISSEEAEVPVRRVSWKATGMKMASAPMVRSQKQVPIDPILLCAKGGTIAPADAEGLMVRIAAIAVDPAQLDAYKSFLTEEQEASVRLEPGVLMLHSFQYADDPAQVRLLEVYADREAYQSHLKTPHFLKYKTGTEKMVKSLELIPAKPILLAGKAKEAGGPTCM